MLAIHLQFNLFFLNSAHRHLLLQIFPIFFYYSNSVSIEYSEPTEYFFFQQDKSLETL